MSKGSTTHTFAILLPSTSQLRVVFRACFILLALVSGVFAQSLSESDSSSQGNAEIAAQFAVGNLEETPESPSILGMALRGDGFETPLWKQTAWGVGEGLLFPILLASLCVVKDAEGNSESICSGEAMLVLFVLGQPIGQSMGLFHVAELDKVKISSTGLYGGELFGYAITALGIYAYTQHFLHKYHRSTALEVALVPLGLLTPAFFGALGSRIPFFMQRNFEVGLYLPKPTTPGMGMMYHF